MLNPIDLTPLFPRPPCPKTILWVGKSDERVKRPSIVLELARQLNQFEFVIVMNRGVATTHEECLAAAKELPNVTLLERVPFSQIEAYFAAARLHLNTSDFEGFPNTFLQAAKYGVPTLSLQVDPGAMLSSHGSGVVCGGNLECLRDEICRLMEDQIAYDSCSRQALQYVSQHHDKNTIIGLYERVLSSVLDARVQ